MFRFSITQVMVATVLAGLFAGLVRTANDLPRHEYVHSIDFSPDGKRLVVTTYSGIDVWYLDGDHPRRRSLPIDADAVLRGSPMGFLDNEHFVTAVIADSSSLSAGQTTFHVVDTTTNELVTVPSERTDYFIEQGDSFSIDRDTKTAPIEIDGNVGGISIVDLVSGEELISYPVNGTLLGLQHEGDLRCVLLCWRASSTYCDTYEDGELVKSTRIEDAYHLTPDGAMVLRTGNGSANMTSLEAVDSQTGTVLWSIPWDESSWHTSSEDSRVVGRFATEPHSALYVYDSTTGKPLGVQKISGLESFEHTSFSEVESKVAISTTHTSDGIVIWNYDDDTTTILSYERPAAWLAVAFGLGFVAWGVLWGWMHRKEASQRAAVSPTQQVSSSLLMCLVFIGMILALMISDNQVNWSSFGWLCSSASVFFIVVFLFFLFGLPYIYALTGRRYKPQIKRSEQIAGPMTRWQVGRTTAMFCEDSFLFETFEQDLELARAAASEIYGREITYRRPLYVVTFNEGEHFRSYLAMKGRLTGVYFGWLFKQIAISEENCRQNLLTPSSQLYVLLGFYFADQESGGLPQAWVSAMLNAAIVSTIQPDNQSQLYRIFRVLDARTDESQRSAFLKMSAKELRTSFLQDDASAADRAILQFHVSASALMQYFLKDEARRQHWQTFLNSPDVRKRDAAERLSQRLGCTVNDMVARACKWALQQPIEPDTLLTDWVSQQMQDDTLPTIADVNADLDRRREAIRALGKSGSLAGFQLLLRMVREEEGGVRTDSIDAIERMTGEKFGDDVAAWQAWWKRRKVARDDDVVTATTDESPSDVFDADVVDESKGKVVVAQVADDEQINDARAPSTIWGVWIALGLGGFAAITQSVAAIFALWIFGEGAYYEEVVLGPLHWFPYLVVGGGVFAMTRAVGCYRRTLDGAAWWLAASALSCNAITMVCGLTALALLNFRASKDFTALATAKK